MLFRRWRRPGLLEHIVCRKGIFLYRVGGDFAADPATKPPDKRLWYNERGTGQPPYFTILCKPFQERVAPKWNISLI